ncbi:hypothetical protein JTE90_023197, partial [Oedothorax gibbosus]
RPCAVLSISNPIGTQPRRRFPPMLQHPRTKPLKETAVSPIHPSTPGSNYITEAYCRLYVPSNRVVLHLPQHLLHPYQNKADTVGKTITQELQANNIRSIIKGNPL